MPSTSEPMRPLKRSQSNVKLAPPRTIVWRACKPSLEAQNHYDQAFKVQQAQSPRPSPGDAGSATRYVGWIERRTSKPVPPASRSRAFSCERSTRDGRALPARAPPPEQAGVGSRVSVAFAPLRHRPKWTLYTWMRGQRLPPPVPAKGRATPAASDLSFFRPTNARQLGKLDIMLDDNATQTFRVLLIDPSPLRRAGLAQVLLNWAGRDGFGFEVAEARSPWDTIEALDPMHLAMLSIGGGTADAPETLGAIGSLVQRLRDVPVVVLSDRETAADIAAVLKAGARGYISTCMDPCVTLRALRFIIGGGVVFPPEALLDGRPGGASDDASRTSAVVEAAKDARTGCPALTSRENDVLHLLCLGYSNKQIGLGLRLHEATVKVHVRMIMRKLGAVNRTQAALRAREMELAVASPTGTGEARPENKPTIATGMFVPRRDRQEPPGPSELRRHPRLCAS